MRHTYNSCADCGASAHSCDHSRGLARPGRITAPVGGRLSARTGAGRTMRPGRFLREALLLFVAAQLTVSSSSSSVGSSSPSSTGSTSSTGSFTVQPIPDGPEGWSPAEVIGADLRPDALSEADFRILQKALRRHSLLVFRNQADLDPADAAAFVQRFDSAATTIWRDQRTNPWERHKAEHMGGAGTYQLPLHPASLALGTGPVKDHFGLTATLGGHRKAYGASKGSQVIGGGQLQWHIDGAFWPTAASSGLPCKVTGMRCIYSPAAASEEGEATGDGLVEIDYGDGSVLLAPKGSTVFASGRLAWSLLTPGERERALRTSVTYSQHPFKRFAHLTMTKDGLRCVDPGTTTTKAEAGSETGLDAFGLSAEDYAVSRGRLTLPLIWAEEQDMLEGGSPALMPHTRCLEHMTIHPAPSQLAAGSESDGTCSQGVDLDVDTSRSYLHGLMRRAIDPANCYAHGWRPGDFAIWDNHALWHSATGGLDPEDRRLMHLIAFDAAGPPVSCGEHLDQSDEPHGPHRVETTIDTSTVHILALVIGQTPRPDLVEPFHRALSQKLGPSVNVEVTTVGALDGADEGVLSEAVLGFSNEEAGIDTGDSTSCPLVTKLSSGQGVTVSEAVLAPLLEQQMIRAVRERASDPKAKPFTCAVLLCAGSFPSLCPVTSTILGPGKKQITLPLLVKPFETAAATLAAFGSTGDERELFLFVPNEEQRTFAEQRWASRCSGAPSKIQAFVLPEADFDMESPEGESKAVESSATSVLQILRDQMQSRAKLAGKHVGGVDEELPENLVLVLDYVGHPLSLSDRVRQLLLESRLRTVPVLDVGSAMVHQIAGLVRSQHRPA